MTVVAFRASVVITHVPAGSRVRQAKTLVAPRVVMGHLVLTRALAQIPATRRPRRPRAPALGEGEGTRRAPGQFMGSLWAVRRHPQSADDVCWHRVGGPGKRAECRGIPWGEESRVSDSNR